MAQQSKKQSVVERDNAAIRQRKAYRKRVFAKLAMTAGIVTQTTYGEVQVAGAQKKGKHVKPQSRVVAQRRIVPKVTNNPCNRNARINGLTVGDAWKLAQLVPIALGLRS